MPEDDFVFIAMQQAFESDCRFPFAVAFMFPGKRVENGAAANGLHRGIGAQHEAVSTEGGDRLIEADLDEGRLTRSQLFPIEEHRRGKVFGRSRVEADFGPMLERARRAGEEIELYVEQVVGTRAPGVATTSPR